jgi:hypothetical protein
VTRLPGPQEKRAATAQGKGPAKRQARREDEEEDDDDLLDQAAREIQSQRERESDPKRYKGIRGFFRRIFD